MLRDMSYTPPDTTLEKYADILINFALGNDEGISPGDVVYFRAPEYAKPLYVALQKTILQAGGHPLGHLTPDNNEDFNVEKDFFEHADNDQISFFPEQYVRGLIDQSDHVVRILAETDKHALEGVDSKKIMGRAKAWKPFKDWLFEKENDGKLTWTLALYGTPAMAEEAGLSLEAYWKQIEKACFLDTGDPIAQWRKVCEQIDTFRTKLNDLDIETIHIEGEDADLHIRIGEKRVWKGGSGRNIPSFEIFTSPDWRGTEGWIRFNQPLYRYGNLVRGIELHFKDGKVTKASAEENEQILLDMIDTENADKVGEFSLTDSRHSRITHFMAETLYDENMGGEHGNTHIALGNAYRDCFDGDVSAMTEKDWEDLGFNNSAIHTDLISTADRSVTATLKSGEERVIYKNGQFQL